MIHVEQYRVRYADTDQAGVVYYGNYLRFFEIGRTEFLRHFIDITYRAIEDDGIIMPVVEAYTRYKAPAYYDELLLIETAVSAIDEYTVTFFYRIVKHGEDSVIVQGSTKLAAINKIGGHIVKLPKKLYEKLRSLVITSPIDKEKLN